MTSPFSVDGLQSAERSFPYHHFPLLVPIESINRLVPAHFQ